MKPVVCFLAFVMFLQIMFDAMMFDSIVHGEVAWRWQRAQGTAFLNSAAEYPGYYCGQHNCALSPGLNPPK